MTADPTSYAAAIETTTIRRAYLYKLTPTSEQAARLAQWVGVVRLAYNLAMEQRRVFGRPGRRFNAFSQAAEITALRAEFDWVRDAPSSILHQALRDLDRAYKNWWSGRAGAPTPRKRGVNDAMRFHEPAYLGFRRLSKHLGEVRLPKIGWVRLRWDRPIPGTLKNITVSRQAGEWFASAQFEIEAPAPNASTLPPVGIDRGIALFAAFSTGATVEPLNAGKAALRALARAQRNLSRKKKGSSNRRRAVMRVARLHARVGRTRNDFLHKLSTNIAKNHGAVVIEKLEVSDMVRSASGTIEKPGRNVRAKSGLNRSILDQGWTTLKRLLVYKLEERGGEIIEVDPRYTSQTCSACGVIDAESRKEQRFCCTSCGHTAQADLNAAQNILKRGWGTALLPVEASRQRAVEAGTIGRVA